MSASTNLAVRGKASSSGGGSTASVATFSNGAPLTDTQMIQAITDDHADGKTKKLGKDFLYQNGFRTDFGTNKQAGTLVTEVETNYLDIIIRPKDIHVYKIIMVREYQNKTLDDGTTKKTPALVTRRAHKEAIFNHVQHTDPSLSTQELYATDFDLIWSVVPLFQHDDATVVPPPFGQVDGDDPITGKTMSAEHVEIKYDRTIDLGQTVARLFRKQTTSSITDSQDDDNDDPAVLTRGINAFFSGHAKSSPGRLTSPNANTFYRNNTSANLDRERCLKVLQGFFLSLRPGSQSLMLNINVKHSPFMHPEPPDAWMQTCQDHGRTVRETRGCVRGKAVKIRSGRESVHAPNGVGVITSIGNDDQQKPKGWADLEPLSDLLINIGSKKKGEELDGRDYFYACELELIDNQPFHGMLTGDQTTAMLDQACKRPEKNKQLILDKGLSDLGIDLVSGQQYATKFGLHVNPGLMKVPARLLSTPTLYYPNRILDNKSVALASWNLVDLKLFNPTKLSRLPIFDLHDMHHWSSEADNKRPRLDDLESVIRLAFANLGIAASELPIDWRRPQNPARKLVKDVKGNEFSALRQETMKAEDIPGPVLVLLPKHDYDLYSRVKRLFDRVVGAHAVCAASNKMDNFGKPNENGPPKGMQYMANIGMKMNLKVGGTNQHIADADLKKILMDKATSAGKTGGVVLGPKLCETIIIGADVAHPTGSAVPGCPSIASVVGSVDNDFVQYPGSMRLQRGRQEFIADLAGMVKERLIDWADKHDNRLPTSVLFYRDGVSESQYDTVRSEEIPQLETAFELAREFLATRTGAKGSGKAPRAPKPDVKLTFVIVGKRHNTRFYATREQDTFNTKYKDKNGNTTTEISWNVKPGFVIDKKITHPYSNDFFLQSHQPLQGTGRSAHYFVLQNQMRFSADELQKVTHSLCYIYARATKGVSYCAPAYYADKLCDRGRAYLRPWLTNADGFADDRQKDEDYDDFRDRIVNSISDSNVWIPAANQQMTKYGSPRKNPWHPNLDNIMFYL